jgi:hypothetical protein
VPGDSNGREREYFLWYFPLTLISPWVVLTISGAVRLTGKTRPLAALGLSVVTLVVLYPLLIFILAEHERIAAITGIALIAGTVWLLIAARRRSLIGWPTIGATLGIWLALAGVAIPHVSRNITHPSFATMAVFLAGIFAVVVAPMAAFPLALACNRNR